MNQLPYSERMKNTQEYIENAPHYIFSHWRKDGKAAKVNFFQRIPAGYDNKKCIPWGDVRGRYWAVKSD